MAKTKQEALTEGYKQLLKIPRGLERFDIQTEHNPKSLQFKYNWKLKQR